MALHSKHIDLTLEGGIQENTDDKQLDVPNMLEVTNGVFTRKGRITKRKGSRLIGLAGPEAAAGANALFLHKGNPVLLGNGAYRYTPGVLAEDTGILSPTNEAGIVTCNIKSRPTVQGGLSAYDFDMASRANSSGESGVFCVAWRQWDDVADEPQVWWQLQDQNGFVLHGPRPMDVTACPGGYPRVIALGDGGAQSFVIFAANDGGDGKVPLTASVLKYIVIDAEDTSAISVSALGTISGGVNAMFYDAFASTSDYGFLTMVAGANVYVRRFTAVGTTLTQTHSASNTLPAGDTPATVNGQCSIYDDGTTFYLAIHPDDGMNIILYNGDATDLSPFTLGASSIAPLYDNVVSLSIGPGVGAELTIAYTSMWDQPYTDSLGMRVVTEIRDITAVSMTTVSGNYEVLSNFALASKVFRLREAATFSVHHVSTLDDQGTVGNSTPVSTLYPVGLLVSRYTYTKEVVSSQGTSTQDYVGLKVVARHNQGRAAMNRRLATGYYWTYVGELPQPEYYGGPVCSVVRNLNTEYDHLYQFMSPIATRVSSFDASNTQCRYSGSTVTLDSEPKPLKVVEVLNGLSVYSGGNPGVFDGTQAYELSPHYAPYYGFASSEVLNANATNLAYKGHWKVVFEWTDALGNLHRTAPSKPIPFDISGASRIGCGVACEAPPISAVSSAAAQSLQMVVYRTDHNGTENGPYFATVRGKPELFGPGGSDEIYAVIDDIWGHINPASPTVNVLTEASSFGLALYTDGGELPVDAPPAFLDICTDGRRVYGLSAEHPSEVRPSKLLTLGYAPEFSDSIYVPVPGDGGEAVAIEVLDEKIVVFKENAIFYFTGPGPNNNGLGDFSDVNPVTYSTGCSERTSVVKLPEGLMFHGKRGWYILDRGLSLKYIGLPVETSMQGFNIKQAVAIPESSEVRITGETFGLCYNYMFDAWSVFDLEYVDYTAISACVWNGEYARYLGSTGIALEDPAYGEDGGETFFQSITTPWIKLAGLQGFQRVRRLGVLGTQNLGGAPFEIGIGYNYASGFATLKSWTAAELSALTRFQVSVHIPRQKCESIRFQFHEYSVSGGLGFTISGVSLEVGVKNGGFKHLPDGAKR